jgi:Lrp/AsnC family leucine-responsive transcriptional regulator
MRRELDLAHYQRFLVDKLLSLPIIREVRSNIAIQSLKTAAALPLDHLEPAQADHATPRRGPRAMSARRPRRAAR